MFEINIFIHWPLLYNYIFSILNYLVAHFDYKSKKEITKLESPANRHKTVEKEKKS